MRARPVAGRLRRILALGLAAAVARLLAPLGVAPGDNDADGGADVEPLQPAAVPLLELDQDGSRYFDVHHTANDTLDKVDAKDLDQNVAAWAAVAWALADAPGDLGPGRAPAPEQAAAVAAARRAADALSPRQAPASPPPVHRVA